LSRKRQRVRRDERHLRKVPTQARSRKRLEAILDAAASLFADQGFDATTMEAIAGDADTSVGSVYQFFPNKLALFRGVADRCHTAVRTAYTALVGPDPASRDVNDLIDTVVDGFYALQRSDPSFRAVWTNTQLYGELLEDDLQLEREIVAGTSAVLAAFAPELPASQRVAAAMLFVQTVSAGLFLVLREPSEERNRALIAELKRMLRAYAGALVA
jgi:AcrR family transcriptional regulator